MDIIALAMAKTYTDSQRLGYAEVEETIFLPEVTATTGVNYTKELPMALLIPGYTYIVIYDGVAYECVCKEYIEYSQYSDDQYHYSYLGNLAFLGDKYPKTDEPFTFWQKDTGTKITAQLRFEMNTTHTVSINYVSKTIHTIGQEYIPPMDSITLNGADGNQYKLFVDENGQLQMSKI